MYGIMVRVENTRLFVMLVSGKWWQENALYFCYMYLQCILKLVDMSSWVSIVPLISIIHISTYRIRGRSKGGAPRALPPSPKANADIAGHGSSIVCGIKLSMNLLSHYLPGILVQIWLFVHFQRLSYLNHAQSALANGNLRECGQRFESVA